MAKQIYNTRGMDLDQVKEVLRASKENARTHLKNRIEDLRDELDHALRRQQKTEEQIAYLEKYVQRKEKELTKKIK